MWVVSHDIYLSLSDLNFTYYDEIQVQSEDFFGLCAFSPRDHKVELMSQVTSLCFQAAFPNLRKIF